MAMALQFRMNKINISPGFKRYFANTSRLMGHRVLSMVVALFVGVYVARYLGPERFGLLSYAGSFVGLFTAPATLGLDGVIVRELVKTSEGCNPEIADMPIKPARRIRLDFLSLAELFEKLR